MTLTRLRAVLAHQQLVVNLLDTRLPDDGAALQPIALDLPFACFADVPEQVRGKRFGRVLARRHLVNLHVRQLGVELPRQDRRDLRQRRIVHNHDWAIGRLTEMAVDDLLHVFRIEARDLRQNPNRPVEVLGVLADDGDGERTAILDQHLAVAIEHHAARRAQGDRALMVVLGQLVELLVLDDLQVPEAEGENRKHDGKAHLQHDETNRHAASIFDWCCELRHLPSPHPLSLTP